MSFALMSQCDLQNAVDSWVFPRVSAILKPQLISVKPIFVQGNRVLLATSRGPLGTLVEFTITEDVLKTQYYQTPADRGTFIFRQIPLVAEAYSVPFDIKISSSKGHVQTLGAGGFLLKDGAYFYGVAGDEFEATYNVVHSKPNPAPTSDDRALGSNTVTVPEVVKLLASLKSALAEAEHPPQDWAMSRTAMGQITSKQPISFTVPFDFAEKRWGSFAYKRDAWLAVAAVNALPRLITELENHLDL